MAVLARRAYYLAGQARGLAALAAMTVTIQALIGGATLMSGVPVWLGVLHQLGAVMVLAVATGFAWRVRRM